MNQHHRSRRTRRLGSLGAVVLGATALVAVAPTGSATAAASCSAVEVDFARGTGEAAGLGTVGGPFVSALTSDLAGKSVSSYAVNYAADVAQTSGGAGSTDLTNHLVSAAAACPNEKFVLGGYSQGATVVDKSLGISIAIGGTGTTIPAALAPRVAAVVVFGNPLGLFGQKIETASATYGGRADSFCNSGDPVCGSGFNVAAHLQYASNGSTTKGAAFAAAKLG